MTRTPDVRDDEHGYKGALVALVEQLSVSGARLRRLR